MLDEQQLSGHRELQSTEPPRPLDSIRSYHAHIYFETPEQRAIAEHLRVEIGRRFFVLLGRWHERPIGPHARPMYQVAFSPEEFPRLMPWLMLNRRGLAILIHPNTGRPKADHLENAMWLGEVLEIFNQQLLADEEGPEAPLMPNTDPTVKP